MHIIIINGYFECFSEIIEIQWRTEAKIEKSNSKNITNLRS